MKYFEPIEIPANTYINEPRDFIKYIRVMHWIGIEKIVVCAMDIQNKVLKAWYVSYDETNSTAMVSFRDLFRELLNINCYNVIMVHNHPFSPVNPSLEDISLTQDFNITAQNFAIELIDHLIINETEIFSFKESNIMNKDKSPQQIFDNYYTPNLDELEKQIAQTQKLINQLVASRAKDGKRKLYLKKKAI